MTSPVPTIVATPSVRAVGAPMGSAGGDTAIPLPTYVANDILVCLTETDPGVALPAPSGWERLGVPLGNGISVLGVYWKRATASETEPVFSNTSHVWAIIFSVKDCTPIGNPWNNSFSWANIGGGGTGSLNIYGTTTTKPNCLIIGSLTGNSISGWSYFNWANPGLSNVTEILDHVTYPVTRHLAAVVGTQGAAGPTGDFTCNAPSTNTYGGSFCGALMPLVPVVISTDDLPSAIYLEQYDQTVQASGGEGVLTYSFTGHLPPGLVFDTTNGRIWGTPDDMDIYDFTVRVTDSIGTFAEKSFRIISRLDIPSTPDLINIGAADICEWHGNGNTPPVEARLYANKSFKTLNGTFVQYGNMENPDFYQAFDLSINGRAVRIEAGDAFATTNSDRPDATYDLDAYDQDGGFLFHILERIRIFPDQNPTTWNSVKAASSGKQIKNPPTYLDSGAILALIGEIEDGQPIASSTMRGAVRLDVDADDLNDPVAVGINSPLLHQDVPASIAQRGSVYLDAPATDPAIPIAVGANSPRVWRNLALDFGNDLVAAKDAIGTDIVGLEITEDTNVAADLAFIWNVRFKVKPGAAINVATGATLYIGNLEDPGNNQIFRLADATAHVGFFPGAIDHYNIAWFAGNQGGDCTQAINECIAACDNWGMGGTIDIPPTPGDWTTTGGHVIDFGTHFRGTHHHPDGGIPALHLVAPNTAMFYLPAVVRDVGFKDMMLVNDGQTNVRGVEANGGTSSMDFVTFKNTCFKEFTTGFKLDDNGNCNFIKFEECSFMGNTDAGIFWNCHNGGFEADTTFFSAPDAGWGVKLGAAPFAQFRAVEHAGGGTTGGFMYKSGEVGNLLIEGYRDENNGICIFDGSNTGTFNVVTFFASYISGRIVLNTSASYNFYGCNFNFDKPIQESFALLANTVAQISAKGCKIAGVPRAGGPIVSNPRLGNFAWAMVYDEDIIQEQMKYSYALNKILDNGPWAVTYRDRNIPVLSVLTESNDRELFALGEYFEPDRQHPVNTYNAHILPNQHLRWRFERPSDPTGSAAMQAGWIFDNFALVHTPVRPSALGAAAYNDLNMGRSSNFVFLNSTVDTSVTGLTFEQAPKDGQWAVLINTGTAFTITLAHENVASTTYFRLHNSNGVDIALGPDQQAFLVYDASLARWRVSRWGVDALTVTTPPNGDNDTSIATSAFVQGLGVGAKVYEATLTQSGSGAPVATVLNNTLGVALNWARTSAGFYTATAASGTPFTANKTVISIGDTWTPTTHFVVLNSQRTSTSLVTINTKVVNVTVAVTPPPPSVIDTDGILTETLIRIVVYP